MNVTIWGTNRKVCLERLLKAYGEDLRILEESPIMSKSGELIGFRFFCKYE